MCDCRGSARASSSTFHLYTSTWYCSCTAYRCTRPATKCKDEKWTGLLSRSSSNQKTSGNKALAQHIINDVIKQNPCHIVVAQEVDAKTEQAVRDVISPEGRPPLHAPAIAGQASSSSGAFSSAAPATAGLASSPASSATAVQPMWIVAVGVEGGNGKTNLVAARSACATGVKILE